MYVSAAPVPFPLKRVSVVEVVAFGSALVEIEYSYAGTYYYKIKEVVPNTRAANVEYDDTVYYVRVVVEPVNGIMTVTSAKYATTLNTNVLWSDLTYTTSGNTATVQVLYFTNTYTASGSTDISVIKVLEGRDFNVGETFTFMIEARDDGAPTLTVPNADGVTFVDNGDGTYTVTVTVLDTDVSTKSDAYDNTWVLSKALAHVDVDQDDVRSWVYVITEVAGSTAGMSYDTFTYGRILTLTVSDNGDGTLDTTLYSTNDVDWDGDGYTDRTKTVIVNSFSSGSTNIYGTVVWVDGGRTHDNSNEVELTLQYYDSDAGEWVDYDDTAYTVTWSGDDWDILGLPEIDNSGDAYVWRVIEKEVDGYVTTYASSDADNSDAEAVPADNSYSNRYTITNTLETVQTGEVIVSKTVKDAGGNAVTSTENTDRFNFVLYTEESGVITEYASGELQAGETIIFSDIPLGTYYLTEELEIANEHTYSTTVEVDNGTVTTPIIDEGFNSTKGVKTRTVEITVTDGGTVRVEFTNQEEESEPSVTPEPTDEPTPTPEPTVDPTVTPEPTDDPTVTPTVTPTAEPTEEPTATPTVTPTPTAEAGTSSGTETKPDSATESDEEIGTEDNETTSGRDTEIDAVDNTATDTGDNAAFAGYICMILLSLGVLTMEETFGRKRKRKE